MHASHSKAPDFKRSCKRDGSIYAPALCAEDHTIPEPSGKLAPESRDVPSGGRSARKELCCARGGCGDTRPQREYGYQTNENRVGNCKGTLSDEQGRKPATTTREQARRINSLAFGVVTAGWRFESSAAHHFFSASKSNAQHSRQRQS